jgi:hypothetical protein
MSSLPTINSTLLSFLILSTSSASQANQLQLALPWEVGREAYRMQELKSEGLSLSYLIILPLLFPFFVDKYLSLDFKIGYWNSWKDISP